MAARVDHGRVQLLTRTGLDWSDKYPSILAALANLHVKTAYLDGELCGGVDAGLPSFANTKAVPDSERVTAAPLVEPVPFRRLVLSLPADRQTPRLARFAGKAIVDIDAGPGSNGPYGSGNSSMKGRPAIGILYDR